MARKGTTLGQALALESETAWRGSSTRDGWLHDGCVHAGEGAWGRPAARRVRVGKQIGQKGSKGRGFHPLPGARRLGHGRAEGRRSR
jgi:hypothetical protein